MSFRQLVCFEKTVRNAVTHDKAVSEVFRAMMPVFNNCSKSVITPLLATGCQVSFVFVYVVSPNIAVSVNRPIISASPTHKTVIEWQESNSSLQF
jgi:hypothetical protein